MCTNGDTCWAVPALLLGALANARPAHAQQERGLARPSVAATVGADTGRSPSDTAPAAMVGDPIATATREYRASGIARTVVQGNFLTFPYGHAQPTLTCTVLRACVIELEPGEIVLSRISGDTERWEISPAPAGPDGRTVLIVVKPHECDITTNLVLATDRRLYDLTLDAPPCKGRSTNPQQPYVRHVRFYYPDDMIAQLAKPGAAPVRIGADVLSLNFAYRAQKDRHFPWAPAQVFDDGARVYLKLPAEARHAEAPVLFVLEADGSRVLVNYAVVGGDTYVTDRLFDRAVLVAGVGGQEQQVLIERTEIEEYPASALNPFGAH
jgi:P-type conjugative transfer protein TrbG